VGTISFFMQILLIKINLNFGFSLIFNGEIIVS
jgi:hypothetical protein